MILHISLFDKSEQVGGEVPSELLVLNLEIALDFIVYLHLFSLLQVEVVTLHSHAVSDDLTILLYLCFPFEVVYAVNHDLFLVICFFLLEVGLIEFLAEF